MVCNNEFLEELIKLVKKETPPGVQEKVLSLIQVTFPKFDGFLRCFQSWADAFRGIPDCADVVNCYEDLKKKGIEFPATDLDTMAPVVTPKRVCSGKLFVYCKFVVLCLDCI